MTARFAAAHYEAQLYGGKYGNMKYRFVPGAAAQPLHFEVPVLGLNGRRTVWTELTMSDRFVERCSKTLQPLRAFGVRQPSEIARLLWSVVTGGLLPSRSLVATTAMTKISTSDRRLATSKGLTDMMFANVIKRILTPGSISEQVAFVVGILMIFGVSTTDYLLDTLTSSEIHMRMVYVIPMTLIALHSNRVFFVILGFVLSFIGMLIATLRVGGSISSEVVELSIGAITFAIIVYFTRKARRLHLEAISHSIHDSLTRLNNRRSFESRAEIEIARQKRYGSIFSLALLDLDYFKELNDSRGHLVGDAALKLFADVLRKNIRETDFAARLGGDEFVILMPNTIATDCSSLCHQLLDRISIRMVDAGFKITASIGYATFDHAPDSVNDALHKTDEFMYIAKARGKGCVAGILEKL